MMAAPKWGRPVPTLRLLSQNAQILPTLCDAEDLARATALARFIREATPQFDVVGMQEVFDEDVRERLVEELPHPHLVAKSDDGDWFNEDSGLFFASQFAIDSHVFAEFDQKAYTDALADKGIFGARLDTTAALGVTLCVFHTHLQAAYEAPHQYASIRAGQLDQVLEAIAAIVAPFAGETAVLLFGDLNVEGDSPEYFDMLSRLGHPRDLYREAHPVARGFTVDGHVNGRVDDGQQRRLDYVFAFDQLALPGEPPRTLRRIEVDRIRIAKLQHDGAYLSDHFGLDAKLRIE